MQDEVHERLVPALANILDKRLRWELFSQLIGGQPVLGKGVVEFIDNYKEKSSGVNGLGGNVEANLGCHQLLIVLRSF